jgi:hypothetical protein
MFCQNLIENCFLEENVATFMSIGYTIRSSLEKNCQLYQNLFRDACHPGSITKLKKKNQLSHLFIDKFTRLNITTYLQV